MDQTIGTQKLMEFFGCLNNRVEPTITEFSNSFNIISQSNPKYVEPFFKIVYGSNVSPQIILVTAAGAVGKSELTKYLSSSMKIPVLDLAKNPPVGDSTLTGVISKTYDSKREITSLLTEGKYGIVIDALDEGALKVRHDAFLSFLDDVALWVPKEQKTVAICMLGRTNIMEQTALYLEEKGIRPLLVQIEPFTIEKAREFLDKQVSGNTKNKYSQSYKEVINFIINSIDSFFKNQGEAGKSSYRNFIGYAPVLLAISKLLNSEPNYNALLTKLKEKNFEKVKLLIHLTQDILIREKDKIITNLTDSLFAEFDRQTIHRAKTRCYTEEEQLERILCKALNIKADIKPTGTPAFDEQYNKLIEDFLKEHPFLSNGKIVNVVFESYLIARLAAYGDKYREHLDSYMQRCFKNSFAFYPIVTTVFATLEQPIPQFLFGNIYSSLINQSVQTANTQLDISRNEDDEEIAHVFFENDKEEFEDNFDLAFDYDNTLNIGTQLTNASISGNFNILLPGNQMIFTAPISILCNTLSVNCGELLLYPGENPANNVITVTCKKISQDYSGQNGFTRIIEKCPLRLYANNQPDFPLIQYYKGESQFEKETDLQKYQKLTNILVQFRGHKKQGDWGKKKDKIDRRFEQGIGLKVKEALIASGVIYADGHLYKLNPEKMQQLLNLSYSDMMSGQINDKVKKFIYDI